VLGGMPRVIRGAIATSVAAAALAIAAAPAVATTDRADYAAQVNPICKSANSQQKQLYEGFEQALDRIDKKRQTARGKKRAKLNARLEKLFSQLPAQSLAIADAEEAQLRQVAAAPGDEALVSDWLGNRQAELEVIRQLNAIEARIEALFERSSTGRNIKALLKHERRIDRKVKRLERHADALYSQLEDLQERNLEEGTELGATYCVTGATGTVTVVAG
jgi:hypothetical protein